MEESSDACRDVGIAPEHEKERAESRILSLKGDVSKLQLKQRYLDLKRQEALNKMLDLKGSIRVFCRIRSSGSNDNRRKRALVSAESEKVTVRSVGIMKEFVVDKVFDHGSTQGDVFMEVEPILKSALDGHNVCILAYGQTGTGKTYTMEGLNGRPGIVPRAIEQLFHQICQDKFMTCTLSMSMLEVYMGSLRDLLAPKQPSTRTMELMPRSNLSILRGNSGLVDVEGLTDVKLVDLKQARQWYAKGKRGRSTSWTSVNETSSRSHCLTRITIGSSGGVRDRPVSKLWMVDLGGSERLLKTGATGLTLDEGRAINLSLSALGDVINALKMKRSHIPYRNSKLTQILSDSLGDGSKVLMIVHISDCEEDIGETICSLSFAKRVRSIESNGELSQDSRRLRQKCITELEQQIHDTEEELKIVRSNIEHADSLIRALGDQKGSPRSPLVIDHTEAKENLQATDKSLRRQHESVPRFMAPTVCSRQRRAAAGEANGKLRLLKLGDRNHAAISGLQSFTFSSSCVLSGSANTNIKPVINGANVSKLRDSVATSSKVEDTGHNGNDSRKSSLVRTDKISGSNLSLKAKAQHRRRMSSII